MDWNTCNVALVFSLLGFSSIFWLRRLTRLF
jgi:hypothetical protein